MDEEENTMSFIAVILNILYCGPSGHFVKPVDRFSE